MTESRLEVTRECGERNGELLLNGCRVSVWKDEKLMKEHFEINNGDNCTA